MPASHVQPTDGSQRYSLDVPAIKKSMLIAIFRLPDVCQRENLNKRQFTFFLFFFCQYTALSNRAEDGHKMYS